MEITLDGPFRMRIGKNKLVRLVAEETAMSQKDAEKFLKAFVES